MSTSGINSSIISGLVSDTDWLGLADEISSARKTAATTPLTTKKTTQQNRLSAWQSFNTTLSALTNYIKTNKLNKDDGYESFSAALTSPDSSITPENILGVSIGKGDIKAGSYSIKVSSLAAAEKISSDAFASSTAALGISGDIVINGKTISIAATDTLKGVVTKINSADAGVAASVLNVSSTDHRLQLQATAQGSAGITLANGDTSNVLGSLNLASQSLANGSGSDALSSSFSDATTVLGTLLGLASPQSGSIQIRGTDDVTQTVAIDLATDSLQGVADKINGAAITGVTATVEETTVDGVTTQRLRLTNVESSDLTDNNNVLQAMGVVGQTAKNVLQAGKDASFSIDGYDMTSSSNTVTGVIEGVTLTLKATNPDTAINLDITPDHSTLSDSVSTLVDDISAALSYIKTQNTYDSTDSTSTAPALMGDSVLSGIKRTITTNLLAPIEGNSTYTTAKSIGISYATDGTVSLNTDTFAAALSDNPDEVLNAVKTLSTNLHSALSIYVDPTTGTIQSIQNSINSRISDLAEQITSVEERCDKQAEVLKKQFSALETLISQSNYTKNFLTQQVDAWKSSSNS
jgi:flagellar hook-associated protein 2